MSVGEQSKATGRKPVSVADALRISRQHLEQGRFKAAEAIATQVANSQKAGNADAFHILGIAAFRQGHLTKAIRLTQKAVALAPRSAAFHSNLAEMCRLGGKRAQALKVAQRAVELDSRNAQAWNNLGVIHFDNGDFEAAERCYRRALQIDDKFASAWSNLGNALHRLQKDDEAHAALETATRLNPAYSEAYVNDALRYREAGALAEAEKRLESAIAANPKNANAHVTLSTVRFLRGAYAEGWREYEWRLALPGVVPRGLKGAPWRGEDLTGKHILVFCEQGLGDTIQFSRYLSRLSALQPGRISVLAQERLRPLLRQNFPAFDFVKRPPDDTDFHCPLLSLHGLLKLDPSDRTPMDAYLEAPADRAAQWKAQFLKHGRSEGGACVGRQFHASQRSQPVDACGGLAAAHGHRRVPFLQPADRSAAFRARRSRVALVDLSADVSTMPDTAAAISALDLVISVDTSLAHLAAALGTETWTMLSFVPDWRWGTGGEHAPWYSSMRLFRQASQRDWNSVVQSVGAALKEKTSGAAKV